MDNLPPPIQVTRGDSGGKPPPSDDSLVEFKVKNPFQKFFNWIISFMKRNANITIKIPLIGIFIALFGAGYTIGFNNAISKFFPDSSPLFHRAISVEGIIQRGSSGKFYLKSGDNTWTLKPVNQEINPADYMDQEVTIKGNLSSQKGVIEVAEVISTTPAPPAEPVIPAPLSNPPISSNSSNFSDLPVLYSGLQWETSQKKLLTFTSGKRRIEEQGIYFESAMINQFPQEFINYYLEDLNGKGFKETLNSINPDGITITYSKDNLFLTFGVKYKYSGSGDKKQFTGYKAFIEHN
ncbi:MAG: Uncharacterized protein G01um10147_527 [Microgenomates group bacterium Gr01-1014_7]|nr:MAG: Uncharacterized protein G01um10147_527 [Microgenomates group bacterium Gr01-1014_7]